MCCCRHLLTVKYCTLTLISPRKFKRSRSRPPLLTSLGNMEVERCTWRPSSGFFTGTVHEMESCRCRNRTTDKQARSCSNGRPRASRLAFRNSFPPQSPPSLIHLRQVVGWPERPVPRAHHSLTYLRDMVFVFGGVVADDAIVGDLHFFDTVTRRWSGEVGREWCCDER